MPQAWGRCPNWCFCRAFAECAGALTRPRRRTRSGQKLSLPGKIQVLRPGLYSVGKGLSSLNNLLNKGTAMQRIAQSMCLAVFAAVMAAGISPRADAQGRTSDAATIAHRNAVEAELESVAIIERKVMVPMRDGKRMQADIYRPKDDVEEVPHHLCAHALQLQLLGRGTGRAARYVGRVGGGEARLRLHRDERARALLSEGDYDILGVPLTDADDALDWMGGLPWSADKVGLIGCSSTAEWQLAVASRGNKALDNHHPGEFWRGRGASGSLLRARQFFPWRRGADAVGRLAL